MFKLEKHEASIANLNQRIERHGEDRMLAVDLKLTTSVSNQTLDELASGLREALFRKPGSGEQQQLPTIGEELTAVRFTNLEPLKLAHEFAGYELQIDGLLEAGEPIVLVDVKLKKFVVEPKEGGSVALSFTAQAVVDNDDIALLSDAFVREDVLLTATPPAKQADAGGTDLIPDGDTLDQQDADAEAKAEADRLTGLGKAA